MPFFGIDLGTTHTVMVNVEINKSERKVNYNPVRLLDFYNGSSDDRSILLPSVVYFPEHSSPVVGTSAKNMLTVDPEHVFLNTKVNLGATLQSRANRDSHTPQQAAEEILKVCFSEIPHGSRVMISVPAAFDESKKQETKNAVENAIKASNKKIELLGLTEEPYAAMLNLIFLEGINKEEFKKSKNIMVVDIGGGTLDIMISKIIFDEEENALTVQGYYNQANHDEFAGAKFDHKIMQHLKTQFFHQYNISQRKTQVFPSQKEEAILEKVLLYYAEDAKKYLCDPKNAGRKYEFTLDPYEVPALSFLQDTVQTPFKISIQKSEMDQWLESMLRDMGTYMENGRSIQGILQSALRNNGLSHKDIHLVYLTGGMAKYDKVAAVIKSTLHIQNVIVADDPLLCTAKGVAIHARNRKVLHITGGQIKNPNPDPDNQTTGEISNQNSIINVFPTQALGKSYFIGVDGEMPVEIISAEQTYPRLWTKVSHVFHITAPDRMNFEVYEGMSIYDCTMKVLQKRIVNFNRNYPVGSEIHLEYTIDSDKIITFRATIFENGESETYMLHPEGVQ